MCVVGVTAECGGRASGCKRDQVTGGYLGTDHACVCVSHAPRYSPPNDYLIAGSCFRSFPLQPLSNYIVALDNSPHFYISSLPSGIGSSIPDPNPSALPRVGQIARVKGRSNPSIAESERGARRATDILIGLRRSICSVSRVWLRTV